MKFIMLASMLLAFAAAAQPVPVLSICKDGKLIAPVPDVYTIPIPPDVCAVKPKPKREPAKKAGPNA